MKPKIEFNKLSLELNQILLAGKNRKNNDTGYLWEGTLPVISVPFRFRLESLEWMSLNSNSIPDSISASISILVADPDWSLIAIPKIDLMTVWHQRICKWGRASFIETTEIKLDKDSRFAVDGHAVLLTPTINRILSKKGILNFLSMEKLDATIRKISNENFGSDVLSHLLENAFYKVSPVMKKDGLTITASLSDDRAHFEQAVNISPYIFLEFPTSDMVYCITKSIRPEVKIKSYNLIVSDLKVVGHNKLIININELSKNLDITLTTGLKVEDNKIYAVVESIVAIGLNPLKKLVFNILKSMLIRQIENNPLDIDKIYAQFLLDISIQYPYLTIQNNQSAQLDKLHIDPERTELLIHFP